MEIDKQLNNEEIQEVRIIENKEKRTTKVHTKEKSISKEC